MKKYSEITLNDEEKKILEWFKEQGYTHVGRTTQYGFVEVIDENNDIRCNLKPMRKPFEFIEKGERYEIDKVLNPPHEPKTVWELKKGDIFWYVSLFGDVKSETWNEWTIDRKMRSQGNVFLTKEEAEFEKKRREVVAKIKKYARPFIYNHANFYAQFSHVYQKVHVVWDCQVQSNKLYFDSQDNVKKAIDEVGEEDFKKYYLGVTE